MKQRIISRLLILVLAIGLVALVWPGSNRANAEDTCRESLDSQAETEGSHQLSWESLPHQFFSRL